MNVPRNFVPAVEKGLNESLKLGVLPVILSWISRSGSMTGSP